jgi:Tfp pilus assembly protein PilF
LAEIELKQSSFSNAEGHLRESLQIWPQSISGHDMLAQALQEQGRTKEADGERQLAASLRQQFVQQHRTSSD